jgi:hypothetical protein
MRKHLGGFLLLVCAVLIPAAPALAQKQTVNFSIGGFVPKGEDARVSDDVLTGNRTFLVFDIRDFNSASVGAEWLFPIGHFLEGGAGVSFTRRSVPTVYTCCTDNNGSEIEQELRLRRIPLDLTVRVTPFGNASPVQPYFGGGLTVINWRYSESGDFIDFADNRNVFRATYVDSGSQAGAVVLGGIRFVGDAASGGFEVKFHKADAPLSRDFLSSRIDLGGWTYQGTFGVRF